MSRGRTRQVLGESGVLSNGMPDHRFMYPRVVPVVHNFTGANVSNPLHGSDAAAQASKSVADFAKSDGGHYREAPAQ